MQDIFINNQYIGVPASNNEISHTAELATVLSNMAYYGYAPNGDVIEALSRLSASALGVWWFEVQPVFENVTGADANIGDFIVYKNFPAEVLAMDNAGYVLRQILVYMGVPYEDVREDEAKRAPLNDLTKLKVLGLATDATAAVIRDNLIAQPSRWSDNQQNWAERLIEGAVTIADYGFRANAISMIARDITLDHAIDDATDVLRLAALLSDGDVTLREKVRLTAFKRAERRRLLGWIEGSKNLVADTTERPELWKRLFERLRPGDYRQFPKARAAYDDVYGRKTKSFNAAIDPQVMTPEVLDRIVERPGVLLRNFRRIYRHFGVNVLAVMTPEFFEKVSTNRLVAFKRFLQTDNGRKTRIYAPGGNWSRAQVVVGEKSKIAEDTASVLIERISEVVRSRLDARFPEGIALYPETDLIKLPTNDQELAEYGRGTVFEIPGNIKFIRSASYWAHDPNQGATWFDNGWNFFDAEWKSKGAVAWNTGGKVLGGAAVFSGDPINTTDAEGRAGQMIDLYLDKLHKAGVRYAVWNILSFSRVKFSAATAVRAMLQMGEEPDTGKVFEPSRSQMSFPIKGDYLSKYVAYIDVEERKLVFMDASLRADVSSAQRNEKTLSETMPAYVEYLDSLPSVHDLFANASLGTIPVKYSDEDEAVTGKGYVFRCANSDSSFEPISLADCLS